MSESIIPRLVAVLLAVAMAITVRRAWRWLDALAGGIADELSACAAESAAESTDDDLVLTDVDVPYGDVPAIAVLPALPIRAPVAASGAPSVGAEDRAA